MQRVSRTTGLFTPHNRVWQIHRELLITLAGSRALLLELAHPLVAVGVAEHSNFEQRPIKRLIATIRSLYYLTFGDDESARVVVMHINGCHHTVKGRLGDIPYDADDPELRMWVFATLIDSILKTYEHFIHPLTLTEKAEYYDELRHMARILGIPERCYPPTYGDFRRYMDWMLESGILRVDDNGRAILQALFNHRLLGGLLRFVSFPGIGLMPSELRTEFGLDWTERHQRRLERITRIARWVRKRLPGWMCVYPQTW